METTIVCSICGEPYAIYPYYSGDQSACPDCRGKNNNTGGQTIKCPICKKPYKFYSHYAGDQSTCGECRARARRKLYWKGSKEWTVSNYPGGIV